MARYIDADATLNRLPDDLPYKGSVKRVLIQAPTADVVPRSEYERVAKELERVEAQYFARIKYGEWVYDPNGMDWNLGAWKCSECRVKNDNLGGDRNINPFLFAGSKWCPHCGAKMVRAVTE